MILIVSEEKDHTTNDVIDWLFSWQKPFLRINETDVINDSNVDIKLILCLKQKLLQGYYNHTLAQINDKGRLPQKNNTLRQRTNRKSKSNHCAIALYAYLF